MSSRFVPEKTALEGLIVLNRKPIGDTRGFFERVYCANDFQDFGLSKPLTQMNRTLTHKKGALRGLHFQRPPHAEMKVVNCLRGKVFDVAVDLRDGSPTFGQWHGEILSAENHKCLLIPEGFAHGFQTLKDDTELLYLHTEFYHPESEGGINLFDEEIDVNWPLPAVQLSARDQKLPKLCDGFESIEL